MFGSMLDHKTYVDYPEALSSLSEVSSRASCQDTSSADLMLWTSVRLSINPSSISAISSIILSNDLLRLVTVASNLLSVWRFTFMNKILVADGVWFLLSCWFFKSYWSSLTVSTIALDSSLTLLLLLSTGSKQSINKISNRGKKGSSNPWLYTHISVKSLFFNFLMCSMTNSLCSWIKAAETSIWVLNSKIRENNGCGLLPLKVQQDLDVFLLFMMFWKKLEKQNRSLRLHILANINSLVK